jgi:site-specific DNA-methyltransferase (adenine-specific)
MTTLCLVIINYIKSNPESYKDGSTLFQSPIKTKDKNKFKHPTIKPIEIIDRLIKNSSKIGGIVFDPFMGSGTTGVSCKKLNRKFIGVELLEEFFITSENRINNIDYINLKEVS